MYPVQNYLDIARENEVVFRNVLRDLKINYSKRPGGDFIPEDLETEAPLENIFQKYSSGFRYGVFTITEFTVTEGIVLIGFENVAFLSGGGARLKYLLKDNCIEYSESECVFLS